MALLFCEISRIARQSTGVWKTWAAMRQAPDARDNFDRSRVDLLPAWNSLRRPSERSPDVTPHIEIDISRRLSTPLSRFFNFASYLGLDSFLNSQISQANPCRSEGGHAEEVVPCLVEGWEKEVAVHSFRLGWNRVGKYSKRRNRQGRSLAGCGKTPFFTSSVAVAAVAYVWTFS